MEAAAKFLDSMEVPYEINALSAHRTPGLVATFAEGAAERGVEVIIAAAGGAAHLPGVIAASTVLPVIGVPIRSSNSIEGVDSLYSIVQMPSGIPVATVAINGAQNAAILACQILATADKELRARLVEFKKQLAVKIEKANADLAAVKFPFKVN
jgi:5-(carboxyamino)imidazole ribonucleotide mutase